MKFNVTLPSKILLITLVLLVALIVSFQFLHPKKTHPNKVFIAQAVHQYAAYQEHFLSEKDYLMHFPAEDYSLYTVKNFAKFYLEDKADVIKSKLRQGKRWEKNLLPYMAAYIKPGSQVLDIGAHIGTHTIYFDQLLKGAGMVWAFEPQPKLFHELNANLLLNHAKNVKTLRYAVGGKKSVVEMARAANENEGGTAIGKGGAKADMITIDSLHLSRVSFMKIDVEGYEDEVLKGARQTILKNKPVILCEIVGGIPFQKADKATKQRILNTIATIKNLGYQVKRVSQSDYLAIPNGSLHTANL